MTWSTTPAVEPVHCRLAASGRSRPSEDLLVCHACDRRYDRRRFLRQVAAGGVLAATGVLWAEGAGAAGPPLEALQFGEDRVPRSIGTARATARPSARRGAGAPRIITRAEWG